MKAFEYVAPTTVEGAVDRLEERPGDSLPLAGGMDLLGMMKEFVLQPGRIVGLTGIDSMRGIEATDDGGLRIGALTTLTDVADSDQVQNSYPALVAAANTVGTPQIRNRGTLGGNLCQRPRCWYFRSEYYDCLRKSGSACFAVDGDNRYHAIFDTAPCPIVHPSNCAVALQAYGASVTVVGPDGEQTIAMADFFVRPAQDITRENVVGPESIVTSIELPPSNGARSGAYFIKHKQSHDWPLAMAVAVLQMDGNSVGDARIVMGAVAPTPRRAAAAEQALIGQSVSVATAEAAADAAVADADPMEHNRYKVRLARTAVKRAILEAAGIDWTTA